MIAGIIGGSTWLLGVILVAIGTTVSIKDWTKKRRSRKKEGEFETEGLGAAELLTGLAKVFDALKEYSIGRFLIAVGLVLVLAGAIISTAGALTA